MVIYTSLDNEELKSCKICLIQFAENFGLL